MNDPRPGGRRWTPDELQLRKIVGISLAVGGNLLISGALNVQKAVHMQTEKMPREQRRAYTRMPLWWAGFFMTILGELGNFAAYGFAEASLVTPLGAVSVVSNAFIAAIVLREGLRVRDICGCALVVSGSAIIAATASMHEEYLDPALFMRYVSSPTFLAFFAILLVAICAVYAGRHRCAAPFSPLSPIPVAEPHQRSCREDGLPKRRFNSSRERTPSRWLPCLRAPLPTAQLWSQARDLLCDTVCAHRLRYSHGCQGPLLLLQLVRPPSRSHSLPVPSSCGHSCLQRLPMLAALSCDAHEAATAAPALAHPAPAAPALTPLLPLLPRCAVPLRSAAPPRDPPAGHTEAHRPSSTRRHTFSQPSLARLPSCRSAF